MCLGRSGAVTLAGVPLDTRWRVWFTTRMSTTIAVSNTRTIARFEQEVAIAADSYEAWLAASQRATREHAHKSADFAAGKAADSYRALKQAEAAYINAGGMLTIEQIIDNADFGMLVNA